MRLSAIAILAGLLAFAGSVQGAGFLEKIGLRKKASTNAAPATVPGLSQQEIALGLKEALAGGVERAISSLGRADGFLNDASVKIPMPDSLQRVERTLRTLGQQKLADDFVVAMNRAAEQAVPEAAAVLGDSLKQMTITDATAILTETNNAATQFFRRTSETNLYARFLPIVKKSTEQVGVTSAYKAMSAKANSAFGGLGGNLMRLDAADLDGYVTARTLDGLFVKIAEQEKLIRENPAARATDLLQKVFGAVSKPSAPR